MLTTTIIIIVITIIVEIYLNNKLKNCEKIKGKLDITNKRENTQGGHTTKTKLKQGGPQQKSDQVS